MHERFTSQIESGDQISKLRERLHQWNVTDVAFDFDGTLIDTNMVFRTAFQESAALLTTGSIDNAYPVNVARVYEQLVEIMQALRPIHGINPAVTELSVHIAAKLQGLPSTHDFAELATERMRNIYRKDIPAVFSEAKETVRAFRAAGARPLLMTHAEASWTEHKISMARFHGHFEKVIPMSIDYPKSKLWKQHFQAQNIDPSRTLVIGDNFDADIAPTVSLGARGIWVNKDKRDVYSGEKEKSELSEEASSRVMHVEHIIVVIPQILSAYE
jgi:FMN phosphatase YigB (HAD superfamily)